MRCRKLWHRPIRAKLGADDPREDCTYPGPATDLEAYLAPLDPSFAGGVRWQTAERFVASGARIRVPAGTLVLFRLPVRDEKIIGVDLLDPLDSKARQHLGNARQALSEDFLGGAPDLDL